MHPLQTSVIATLHRAELLEQAAAARRAAHADRLPAIPWRSRLNARKRELGYRLVEAGLRLAIADAHSPPHLGRTC